MPDVDGVPDDEYEHVRKTIYDCLEDIRITARNPEPQPEGTLSETTQGRWEWRVAELARDMRNFPWEDEAVCRTRFATLINTAQGKGWCDNYCLRNDPCRVGYPFARQERMKVTTHPLVSPPTYRLEDWQVIVSPPRLCRSADGEE